MKKYVLSIDLGTTGNRVIIFDREQNIVAKNYKEFHQYFPMPGWVEHDPLEIWETTLALLRETVRQAKISPSEIAAIGITNQRETTILWNRKTGKPIAKAIVWQDRRTAGLCDQLKKKGVEPMIRKKTGLVLDAYFSATKINWLLRNVRGVRQKAENGELAFGTVDTWILWNLTGGKVHATDYSNASRTLLFNIRNLNWDPELLKLFAVPKSLLPEVKLSSGQFGVLDKKILGAEIPITGIAGDQQAALFGQGCFKLGMTKVTYGTGCFLNLNTGSKPVPSRHGLLTTIAWGIEGRVEYALEGSVFMGGAAVQWLRDGLRVISSSSETEALATSVPDNGGVYFVPAMVGLGAPYWDMGARGTIVGITRGTKKEHIVRATLEAIAYQTNDVIQAMKSDSKLPLRLLKVDGGACANNFLMQFQSDILNAELSRPKIIETTALGAAGLAGLAVGFWKNEDEFARLQKVDKIYRPHMKDTARRVLHRDWGRAVERARGWLKS